MEFEDWYDIAEYANENWNKGNFPPKIVAWNAYCHHTDYKCSIENGTISDSIKTICNGLHDDMIDNAECGYDYSDLYHWLEMIANGLGLKWEGVPYWV